MFDGMEVSYFIYLVLFTTKGTVIQQMRYHGSPSLGIRSARNFLTHMQPLQKKTWLLELLLLPYSHDCAESKGDLSFVRTRIGFDETYGSRIWRKDCSRLFSTLLLYHNVLIVYIFSFALRFGWKKILRAYDRNGSKTCSHYCSDWFYRSHANRHTHH